MSTNAVLCITDNQSTIRLTKYRCKPASMLTLLERAISNAESLTLSAVVDSLKAIDFEIDVSQDGSEAIFNSGFIAAQMQDSNIASWAWMLDLEAKTLSYWDVTACLDGMEQTVAGVAESPLDYLVWVGDSDKEELCWLFNQSDASLKTLGITLVNFK